SEEMLRVLARERPVTADGNLARGGFCHAFKDGYVDLSSAPTVLQLHGLDEFLSEDRIAREHRQRHARHDQTTFVATPELLERRAVTCAARVFHLRLTSGIWAAAFIDAFRVPYHDSRRLRCHSRLRRD